MLALPDHRLRLRENLLRISRAITAQLDLNSVLDIVIKVAVEMLAGTCGFIALYEDDDSETLRIRASANLPQDVWPDFAPFLDPAVLDASRDVAEKILHNIADTTGMSLRQVIALPLTYLESHIGIIYVFRAALNVGFSEDDERVLQAFAGQAAIAVSNARLYQRVVREKQHLNAIIEQSADGVMILDGRWRITTFNKAMETLTGWPRSEAIGRPCAEILNIRDQQDEDICTNRCPLQKGANVVNNMSNNASNPVVEGRIINRDSREFYVQIRYAPQYGPNQTFLGAIANVRDITEQKKEEELQSTFVSIISHELKTPVSIIKGYAETLSREDAQWSDEVIRDGLRVIEGEADRLARQIQDLLDVSRLQTGWIHMEMTEWDFPQLAKDVTQGFATQVDNRFEFELRFPDEFPPVHADYERVRMVLSNLVSNAIKYSPDGGLIRIGGRADMEQERAILYVSDQGVGIPPEELERVFERFYRIDNRLRRKTQGTGLGLYLTRAIVKAHGGDISVESKMGRGSRFLFTLPIAYRRITATDGW
jgi:PAS domain S-box-containing protein